MSKSKKHPTPAQIRKARGNLTQTAAGELVYTPMRTWQEWECGRSRMHPAFFELFKLKNENA